MSRVAISKACIDLEFLRCIEFRGHQEIFVSFIDLNP